MANADIFWLDCLPCSHSQAEGSRLLETEVHRTTTKNKQDTLPFQLASLPSVRETIRRRRKTNISVFCNRLRRRLLYHVEAISTKPHIHTTLQERHIELLNTNKKTHFRNRLNLRSTFVYQTRGSYSIQAYLDCKKILILKRMS